MTEVLKLNPFFRVRLAPPLVCDLLLEGYSVALPSADYLAVFADIGARRLSRAELADIVRTHTREPGDAAGEIVDELRERRVLVPADEQRPELDAVRHWIARGWLQALVFHLRTRKLDYRDIAASDPDRYRDDYFTELVAREGPPTFWTEYPDAPRTELPPPVALSDRPLAEVLLSRRSNEPWTRRPVDLAMLSAILTAANVENVRLRRQAEHEYRSTPRILFQSAFSALETYVFNYGVEGLDPGLYHYDPRSNTLSQIRAGVLKDELGKMCIGQRHAGSGTGAFVITADWRRYQYRYRHPRAYRSLQINIGELAHKYILLVTGLGLSTFITPALRDEYAAEVMKLNEWVEAPQYVVAFG